jgi:hypothetical protein
MFKPLRVLLLLTLLAGVAIGAWRDKARATGWRSSLQVAVYPVAADASPATQAYIATLSDESFHDVQDWFAAQTAPYGVAASPPVQLWLAPAVPDLPPAPPQAGNVLQIAAWSLQLRWWSWRRDAGPHPAPQVKLFVLFHDPARSLAVPHSLGLEKGLIGVVHAFATPAQAAQNNVVLAHELLHTLGASDKYDLSTDMPLHPIGYAEPQRQPLWPQARAEIMAVRVPLSQQEARMAEGMAETVIGAATALEIGLTRP